MSEQKNIKRRLKDFVKRLLRNNPKVVSRLYASWAGLRGVPLAYVTFAELADISKKHKPSLIDRKGVNLLGYLAGDFGLAESSRAFARVLQMTQVPHVLNAIEASGHSFTDESFQDFPKENPYNVNLINIHPDYLPVVFKELGQDYFKDRYNIGVWYWELNELPRHWHSSFALLDEIWVTSSFCATVISKLSPVPVVKMTYPIVTATPNPQLTRSHFQIPEDFFAFVFSFDFQSTVERKNPIAVIEAFRRAFGTSDDCVLVLKCINANKASKGWQEMQRAVEGLSVHVIDQNLKHEEVLGLFNCCDCFVSLHRSEGLGLGMLEAMSLGKPVIATGYSGNLEFMNVNDVHP